MYLCITSKTNPKLYSVSGCIIYSSILSARLGEKFLFNFLTSLSTGGKIKKYRVL